MLIRTLFATSTLLILCTGNASAHHSYADFLRAQTVSVEGTIERISFFNPHVMLVIKTDTETYTAEWSNVIGLNRTGVTNSTLKVGDRIIVTGSPKRNPDERFLSLLQEVKRPADGWSWAVRRSQN